MKGTSQGADEDQLKYQLVQMRSVFPAAIENHIKNASLSNMSAIQKEVTDYKLKPLEVKGTESRESVLGSASNALKNSSWFESRNNLKNRLGKIKEDYITIENFQEQG